MKKVIFFVIALSTIVAAVLLQLYFNKSQNFTITKYEKIDISSGENVYTYDNNIYIYGKNGIKIYENTTLIFSENFSIENPCIVTADDKLIIGDKYAKTLKVYNKKGNMYTINNPNTIISCTINKNGYTAIISKLSSEYEILAFNNNGDNIFHLAGITYKEGVPINLTLCNDNLSLAVSFLNTEGSIIESNIAIYSLAQDENSNNSIFGALKKTNQLCGIIKFLDNQNLFILSDTGFYIAWINEKSKTVKEIIHVDFDNKIENISFLDSSGFVLSYGEQLTNSNNNILGKNSIVIYNYNGSKKATLSINNKITNTFSNKFGTVVYQNNLFIGYSTTGSKIFEYHATQDIKSMYFFNSTNKAMLVTENEIKILKLTSQNIKLLEEANSTETTPEIDNYTNLETENPYEVTSLENNKNDNH